MKAKDGHCQEAMMGLPGYVPCNKPGAYIVSWPSGEKSLQCVDCTDHSVQNRGAKAEAWDDDIASAPKAPEPSALGGIVIDPADQTSEAANADKMVQVVTLAQRLIDEKAEVKRLDDEMKAAKKALLKTERSDLPDLMQELGLTQIKLENGMVVDVQEDCTASLTNETRGPALDWMIANEYGGLIKTEVTVAYGRGERDGAVELVKKLDAQDIRANLSETVHHSTLKSFVKERLAEGDAIPMDLFNVYPFNKATVKKG